MSALRSWRAGLLALLFPVCLPALAAAPASPATAPSQSPVRVLIVASREARLAATMEGRLVSLPKADGAAFKRGEVLAEFDCTAQKAELAMAAAREDKARRSLESQQALNKLNAVSDLDLSLAKADQAEATARVEQAQVSVGKCAIVAPYNGRVVRRIANQFETLANGAPVIEIVETGTLRLEMLVPSKSLAWLKAGQQFTLHVDEINRDVKAKITSIGSKVDPVSQTVAVQAALVDQVSGVLPGMSGSAVLGGGAR